MGLLVWYYFGYFSLAFEQFSKKSTNTMFHEESIEEIEPPAITICFDPPFKPSVFEKYRINKWIFFYNNFPHVIANNTFKV